MKSFTAKRIPVYLSTIIKQYYHKVPHKKTQAVPDCPKLQTHQASAANAGQCRYLKIGPRPIPKHRHRPALATTTATDARCDYTLTCRVMKDNTVY